MDVQISTATVPSDPPAPAAWQAGIRAARANLLPGLVVQVLMVALIASYYLSPQVQTALNQLGRWKQAGGLGFVLVASALTGALFPELLKILLLQKGRATIRNGRNLLFCIPLWMLLGFCVDLLYRSQEIWFGAGKDLQTIAVKVAFDQLIYTPFFATPLTVALFDLWKHRWNPARLKEICTPAFYRRRVFPLLIAAWAVWVPLVSIVYAMPGSLQFPVFSLILSFWSLMQAMIATGEA